MIRKWLDFSKRLFKNIFGVLKGIDQVAYENLVSDINSSLIRYSFGGLISSMTDENYSDVLNEVRDDLGRDIDFGNMSDRIAIGDALTDKIRENGKFLCTGSRIKRESC